ncbi:MAG: FadR/GntR family transcriptional regulator [Rubrobacteraceae bacterium]
MPSEDSGERTFSVPPVSSALRPIEIRTAGERIAERLVTAIALGEFVPGQRLPPERELATMLGVSRATVREATQRLAAADYVSIRRGRNGGTYVRTSWGPRSAEMVRRTLLPDWDRLELLMDFRALIERQIARTAAERRTPEDVLAIRKALAAYADAGDDRGASSAADEALHLTIARATQNPYLEELSLQTRRQVSLGFGAEPYSPRVRGRALHQHPQLAEAVIKGNSEEAATLAQEHFSLTESMVRELVMRIRADDDAAGTSTGQGGEEKVSRGNGNHKDSEEQ